MECKGIGLDNAMKLTAAPMFQTDHEKYLWPNSIVAIARGSNPGGAVTYQVYEVK